MVTPSQTSTGGNRSYAVLVVKILLVIVIILLLPKLVTGRPSQGSGGGKRKKKLDRRFLERVSSCETVACGSLVPEESTPCVTECVSSQCHGKIYGDAPLELGEVDERRYYEFERCAKTELRALARQKQ
eukprot:CAMPEP_0183307864 /NCGR_PEP_ID=MMETSP0160_2-20130417/19601_1 /TAXON_ID=2839 ORGANISM="Odontella Sinensis, Strain Grunow 1884" /NCGR_SAMPLE_ID=MMETSP0160_2 /ASSEMBLY_ACC=CAM_ASM_000250 /LENGTH=128 /DNA_ID=CAMNT_0025471565 /DNA_START=57 /DNA_END=443 /DNA_ORIENTATION=-